MVGLESTSQLLSARLASAAVNRTFSHHVATELVNVLYFFREPIMVHLKITFARPWHTMIYWLQFTISHLMLLAHKAFRYPRAHQHVSFRRRKLSPTADPQSPLHPVPGVIFSVDSR